MVLASCPVVLASCPGPAWHYASLWGRTSPGTLVWAEQHRSPNYLHQADSPARGAGLGQGQWATGFGNRTEGTPASLQGAQNRAAVNGHQFSDASFPFVPSLFPELIQAAVDRQGGLSSPPIKCGGLQRLLLGCGALLMRHTLADPRGSSGAVSWSGSQGGGDSPHSSRVHTTGLCSPLFLSPLSGTGLVWVWREKATVVLV